MSYPIPGLDYLINWTLRLWDGTLPYVPVAQRKVITIGDANAYWISRGMPPETMNARLRAVCLASFDPPVSGYQAAILADAPVGYWRLDDAAGSVAANLGSSGVAGGYTLAGGPADVALWAPRTPPAVASGQAVTLVPAVASFVEIPPGPFGAIDFSFELWFRVPAAYASVGYLLNATGAGPQINLQLIANADGSLTAHRRNAAGVMATLNAAAVTRDVWHHVVYRRIPGISLSMYLDGVQVATTADTPGGMAIANAPVSVGGDPTGTNFLNGMIDEVAVYATALTPAQILAHYDARL